MSSILQRRPRPEDLSDKEFYEWVTELMRIHEEHLLMIDELRGLLGEWVENNAHPVFDGSFEDLLNRTREALK